jgi:hypothetical protein
MKKIVLLLIMFIITLKVVGQVDLTFDPESAEKALQETRSQSQKRESSSVSVVSHDFKDNSYTYIGYSNNTRKDIFNNVKEWIAKNFGDYNRVVKLQDSESGKIVMKGKLPPRHDMDTKKTNVDKMIIYYLNTQTEFTLTIEVKEGRYRLKFEDVAVNCSSEKEVKLRKSETSSELIPMSKFCTMYEDFSGLVKYDLNQFVNSVKTAINKAPIDDNW